MSVAHYSPCTCDFCVGKKTWADNWCARCAEVQMPLDRSPENLDVCDGCEVEILSEIEAARTPRIARGDS